MKINIEKNIDQFIRKMKEKGLPPTLIQQFRGYYKKLVEGDSGKIPWAEISVPEKNDLIDYQLITKSLKEIGRKNLNKVAVIKLNGGLGTSMGCSGVKSAIKVKAENAFLDIICQNIINLNQTYKINIPLYFMNSFNTQNETREILNKYSDKINWQDFLQNKFPKIIADAYTPFSHSQNKTLEWNPPGHGDVYQAVFENKTINFLINKGYEYAFISNSDNLGASLDLNILGYMIKNKHTFVMETTPKTKSDIKGGTLINRNNKLELLEIAQVEANHLDDFKDIKVFPVFNTNNIWVHLPTLANLIKDNKLDLTLIINPKQVDETNVIQLETAMGSAIKSFAKACSIVVPRTRFVPVKTTADLLLLRSDYIEIKAGHIRINPKRDKSLPTPQITLSDNYQSIEAFEKQIKNPPSLLNIKSLTLAGNIIIGPKVVFSGDVHIINKEKKPVYLENGFFKDCTSTITPN